jgi:hypothetical protein
VNRNNKELNGKKKAQFKGTKEQMQVRDEKRGTKRVTNASVFALDVHQAATALAVESAPCVLA